MSLNEQGVLTEPAGTLLCAPTTALGSLLLRGAPQHQVVGHSSVPAPRQAGPGARSTPSRGAATPGSDSPGHLRGTPKMPGLGWVAQPGQHVAQASSLGPGNGQGRGLRPSCWHISETPGGGDRREVEGGRVRAETETLPRGATAGTPARQTPGPRVQPGLGDPHPGLGRTSSLPASLSLPGSLCSRAQHTVGPQ